MDNQFGFSSLIVPIDDREKGLIRLSIENRLNKVLELEVEIHQLKINLNDPELVKTLMRSVVDRLDINPMNNDDIFNSFSTNIVKKHVYNYFQLEELSQKLHFVDNYEDLNERIRFPGEIFQVGFILCVRDIKRMKRYVDSFLFNYPIILDTIRYIDLRSKSIISGNGEISSPAAENSDRLFLGKEESTLNTNQQNLNSAVKEENSSLITPTEKTKIDEILEFLLVSPQLLSYLVHLIFNYYCFYNLSDISEDEEKKIEIGICKIFPHDFGINKVYLSGLVESLEGITLDKINLLVKSLSKYLLSNKEDMRFIEIQCVLFILFFYSLRHVTDTNRSWVYSHIEDLFSNTGLQIKMLNKYIPLITGLPFSFVLRSEKELEQLETNLDEISNKFSYLKELDQNQFAELIYSELEESDDFKEKDTKQKEMVLGFKNLVNVTKFFNNSSSQESQQQSFTDLIDNPNNNSKKNFLNTCLLQYSQSPKNKKIISESFDLFLRYLDNPIVLTTEKNQSIPINVISLFERLKSLLNDQNFKKEDISTLQYYHQLLKIIPDDLRFTDVLFIIFQIIIPYMYFFYGITTFEDHFLTTYVNPSR